MSSGARNKLICVAVGAFAVFGFIFTLGPWGIQSDVPVFDNLDPGGGLIRVRFKSMDKDTLLITRRNNESLNPMEHFGRVYRYDCRTRALTVAEEGDWNAATPPIMSVSSVGAGGGDFRLGIDQGQLQAGYWGKARTSVPTIGRTTLQTFWRPGRDRVAVLTTDGHRRFGTHGFFTSFGGGYGGQHYVEFFSVPEMKPVGKEIRIPFTNAEGIDPWRWSEDGKYLIIATSDQRRLCVIHTEPEGD